MKTIITVIGWLAIGSLSLNAQDVSKAGSFTTNSLCINLTTSIRNIAWIPANYANNIFGEPTRSGINPIIKNADGSTTVYAVRYYTYDIMPRQSMFEGAGWIQEGLKTDNVPPSARNSGGCQCVIPTPPHPEYPAAHAVISAASAAVLENIFGEHYSFTDHTL